MMPFFSKAIQPLLIFFLGMLCLLYMVASQDFNLVLQTVFGLTFVSANHDDITVSPRSAGEDYSTND